jgi:pyruvate dehydrogenase complex dehydrogenase (E1) component
MPQAMIFVDFLYLLQALFLFEVFSFVPEGRRYITLGTDGFGRSDTRAALRHFFEVDAASVVNAALYALGLPRQP